MSVRTSLALPLTLAVLTSPALADVLVVGSGPGELAQVQDAIDASSDGDVILVKDGTYAPILVSNRALAIVGDTGAAAVVQGARIADLAFGKSVVLQNLTLAGVASEEQFTGYGLQVTDSAGSVRVEGCVLVGADNLQSLPDCESFPDVDGWSGALVIDSADVVLVDSSSTGGRGTSWTDAPVDGCGFRMGGGIGGHGLYAFDSNVAVYDSVLTGALGGIGGWGGSGGAGLRALGGSTFLSGSTLQGGDGGFGFDFLGGPGGPGGPGVQGFLLLDPTVHVQDSVALGGEGGGSFAFDPGAPGQPTQNVIVVPDPEVARLFDVTSPVRVGESLTLSFRGAPADLVFLAIGGQDAFLPLPEVHGVLLSLFAPAGPFLGILDGNGELSLPLTLGPITGLPGGTVVSLQSFHVGADLEPVLGSVDHLVALDAAF